MFKYELLRYNNPEKNKVKLKISKKKMYVFVHNSLEFTFRDIARILNFINNIKSRHKLSLLPIVINLGNTSITDKLTYILLECICYDLIVKENCVVYFYYSNKKTIYNAGFDLSCLRKINRNKEQFISEFGFEILGKHYRRIVKCEQRTRETLGYIAREVECFLRNWGIDKKCSDDIGMLAGELIDNALEHSDSDCLIDIDIPENIWVADDGSEVYGVNIAVLNFSNILFHENLMRKISGFIQSGVRVPEQYQKVIEAREYHSKYWNNEYTEKDFYAITAFQDKISGRENKNDTGGRGLTQLINELAEKSNAIHCYMVSSDRAIMFEKEYLPHTECHWVGFNANNDYLTDIPDKDCLRTSGINIPGTAYNLTFVLKKEENSNE